MTEEKFAALTERLEARSARWPRFYHAQVLALCLAGYAYILVIFAILIGLAVIGVTHLNYQGIRVVVFVLILLGLTAEALIVTIDRPTGARIRPEEAPRLFEAIEQIRTTIKAPPIHEVIVQPLEFNASMQQIARFGIIGSQRNYLRLGLPLMLALDAEQFRAILAHEYAHASYYHGRSTIWIYRTQAGWSRLIEALNRERHRASFIFSWFFNWYGPTVAAYSLVLSRQSEFEADRLSAQVTRPDVAARALVLFHLRESTFFAKQWPAMKRKWRDRALPPSDLVTNAMAPELRSEVKVDAAELGALLAKEHAPADTHPSLKKRIEALGALPTFQKYASGEGWEIPATHESAAQTYFPAETLQRLLAAADSALVEAIGTDWKKEYGERQKAIARIQELDAAASGRALTGDETWERAQLEERDGEPATIIERLRAVLALNAEHAAANQHLGFYLLQQRDDAGIAHIEQAMKTDPEYVPAGSFLLAGYLEAMGRGAEAQPMKERGLAALQEAREVEAERQGIGISDSVAPPTLTAEQVATICSVLKGDRDVRRAYVVDKVVKLKPERPYRVLYIDPDTSWFETRKRSENEKLLSYLTRKMPESSGISRFVVWGPESGLMRKRVRGTPGSMIYDRDKPDA